MLDVRGNGQMTNIDEIERDFRCRLTLEREEACHARVRMRKRKDLCVLRGKHAEVYLAGGAGGFFDAAQELQSWLAARRRLGIDDSRPLFCHPDGSAFTVSQVRDMVKAVMQAAGRDPARFGAHSLRIGGATAALAAGVAPALIRLMGRWSSDIYEIYCRMSAQAASGVARAMCSQAVDSLESGFHEEKLEMLQAEVEAFASGFPQVGVPDA